MSLKDTVCYVVVFDTDLAQCVDNLQPCCFNTEWYHLALQVTNKGICWAALNGFALTQLPGLLARIHNAVYSDSLSDKPKMLRWALGIRKHVGLLSLWFLFIHVIMRYDQSL